MTVATFSLQNGRVSAVLCCVVCNVQMVRLMICALFIVICTVITVDALKCYAGMNANGEESKVETDCTGGSCLKVTSSSGGIGCFIELFISLGHGTDIVHVHPKTLPDKTF